MQYLQPEHNQARQGDILIIRIQELPEGIEKKTNGSGTYEIAGSHNGHPHTLSGAGVTYFNHKSDALKSYIVVPDKATVVHSGATYVHEAITLSSGTYEIRRQREHVLEGWQAVMD